MVSCTHSLTGSLGTSLAGVEEVEEGRTDHTGWGSLSLIQGSQTGSFQALGFDGLRPRESQA